jgi:hypothetical protein
MAKGRYEHKDVADIPFEQVPDSMRRDYMGPDYELLAEPQPGSEGLLEDAKKRAAVRARMWLQLQKAGFLK